MPNRLSQVNETATSVTLQVTGLNSSSTYSEIYITCNGVTSPNLAIGGSGHTTSLSHTFTGLTCERSYYASYFLRTSIGSTASAGKDVYTAGCPVTPGGIVDLVVTPAEESIDASWGVSTNATGYSVELWHGSTRYVGHYNSTQRSYTFSWLTPGTTYTVKVWAVNNGVNGTPSERVVTTGLPRPQNFNWAYAPMTDQNNMPVYSVGTTTYAKVCDYRDWNALQERVREFQQYKQQSPTSFSSVTSTTIFTHTHYNVVRDAIANLPGKTISTPPTKSDKSVVTFNDIDRLRESLNSTQ